MSPLLRRAVQLLVLALVQAVVLVSAAGTLRWGAAWVYPACTWDSSHWRAC